MKELLATAEYLKALDCADAMNMTADDLYSLHKELKQLIVKKVAG